MAYKLEADETLEAGIRRVVTEEVDAAVQSLTRESPDVAIHEARKAVKKIRAALRLVRAAIGERTFSRENQIFRDIARRLSDIRDVEIQVASFQNLTPELIEAGLGDEAGRIEHRLTQQRSAALARLLTEGHLIQQTRAALCGARVRIRRYHISGDGWAAVSAGFERIYAQGRKRCAVAYKDHTSERVHHWRKRVKDLMYQVRLLERLCPEIAKAWGDDSETLASILGKEHDLAVLRQTIDECAGDLADRKVRSDIVRAIDHHRSHLVSMARPLGDRLYASRSSDISDWLGRYLDHGRLVRSQHATPSELLTQ